MREERDSGDGIYVILWWNILWKSARTEEYHPATFSESQFSPVERRGARYVFPSGGIKASMKSELYAFQHGTRQIFPSTLVFLTIYRETVCSVTPWRFYNTKCVEIIWAFLKNIILCKNLLWFHSHYMSLVYYNVKKCQEPRKLAASFKNLSFIR